ncbi:hypothetical protein HK100_003978 [Physocladia obscura]|uniref:E3 ubiquitin-protein ligase RNF216 RING finger HC subclass domain-containing protein n=1 Tax=Physocladia obscura TaxID=109957 RepID=A0AAD5T7E6_9FUNG|nr:hypothetical protein HK100_003978 [Physocladia obscura]
MLLKALSLLSNELFTIPRHHPSSAELEQTITALLDRLKLPLLNITLPPVAPIEFYKIHESQDFEIGVFVLKQGATMPIHDHPGMTVFTKLVYGELHVKKYELIPAAKSETTVIAGLDDHDNQCRYARIETDEICSSDSLPSPTIFKIVPGDEGANLHSFTALSKYAVIFDVMGPPYADGERNITYYREKMVFKVQPTMTTTKIEDKKVESIKRRPQQALKRKRDEVNGHGDVFVRLDENPDDDLNQQSALKYPMLLPPSPAFSSSSVFARELPSNNQSRPSSASKPATPPKTTDIMPAQAENFASLLLPQKHTKIAILQPDGSVELEIVERKYNGLSANDYKKLLSKFKTRKQRYVAGGINKAQEVIRVCNNIAAAFHSAIMPASMATSTSALALGDTSGRTDDDYSDDENGLAIRVVEFSNTSNTGIKTSRSSSIKSKEFGNIISTLGKRISNGVTKHAMLSLPTHIPPSATAIATMANNNSNARRTTPSPLQPSPQLAPSSLASASSSLSGSVSASSLSAITTNSFTNNNIGNNKSISSRISNFISKKKNNKNQNSLFRKFRTLDAMDNNSNSNETNNINSIENKNPHESSLIFAASLFPDADPDWLKLQLRTANSPRDAVNTILELNGVYPKRQTDSHCKFELNLTNRLVGKDENHDDCQEGEEDNMECGCCYMYLPIEKMTQCEDGHLFCLECARRAAENLIGLRKTALTCLETGGCKFLFPRVEIVRFLTPLVLSGYDRLVQEENLRIASISDLESCPFCDFAIIMPTDRNIDKLFACKIITGYDHFRSKDGSKNMCVLWDNSVERNAKEVKEASKKATREAKLLNPEVEEKDLHIEAFVDPQPPVKWHAVPIPARNRIVPAIVVQNQDHMPQVRLRLGQVEEQSHQKHIAAVDRHLPKMRPKQGESKQWYAA